MDNKRIKYLYRQYIGGLASESELQEFKMLLGDAEDNLDFKNLPNESWSEFEHPSRNLDYEKAGQIYQAIIQNKQHKRSIGNNWLQAAATALVFCLIGAAFFLYHPKKQPIKVAVKVEKTNAAEIMPGSNKAVLTLANGGKVVLDDAKSGQIAGQAGVSIKKLKDGHLVYSLQKTDQQANTKVALNTITIPKGGQYHITLPDGTQVYLNSESSLTYPVNFFGSKRSVSLTGEAYFEVAKNPKMPFDVNVNGKQQIEVLGTHFNVEAYADEDVIKTTLLEGSVKIACQNKHAILKPGQEAIQNNTEFLQVKEADPDEAMAWKNGMFIFNNENITSVMQKVSRWYDIDVVYKGKMEHINFIGNYARSKSLANLLKNIALIEKVHFVTEGRRVTVIAG